MCTCLCCGLQKYKLEQNFKDSRGGSFPLPIKSVLVVLICSSNFYEYIHNFIRNMYFCHKAVTNFLLYLKYCIGFIIYLLTIRFYNVTYLILR